MTAEHHRRSSARQEGSGRALHLPGIFGVFVQARDLDHSLSFYRDVLGLEVIWRDDTLAILRAPDGSAHTVVIRQIGDNARHGLGERGVSRIAFRVMAGAELEHAEELLTQHGLRHYRFRDGGIDWISTSDPDGVRVVLLYADEAALLAPPRKYLYWHE